MTAAVLLRMLMMPGRLFNGLVLVAAASVGAALGVVYELVNQAIFAAKSHLARRFGQADIVPMQEVQQRQLAWANAQLLGLDDTQLPAPLVAALWRVPAGGRPPVDNIWTEIGVGAARAYGQARARNREFANRAAGPQNDEATLEAMAAAWNIAFGGMANGNAPAGPGARPAAAPAPVPQPELARAAAQGVDVHDAGRDPATRRAVATLLHLCPDVDEDASIAELTAEIARQEQQRTPLAQRRHECGIPMLQATRRALGLDNGVAFGGYSGVITGGNRHNFRLDDGTYIPIRRVCATVWHAIHQLREGDVDGEARTLLLREERRDAFFVAIADVINVYNMRVCGPGQTQRMMLVLQGPIEGIAIEDYERIPTVSQFVTYVYNQITADLGDDPTQAQVQARYDSAYQEGARLLPAPLHPQLLQQLQALAQLDHTLAWSPMP